MNRMTELTWKEIRSLAREGALALLPVASMEQHGPHLPVKTDTLLVTEAAEAAVQALGDEVSIALGPTLWLGASNHHLEFFTLSVDELTYVAMVRQIASSLASAGFRRLFILNGHGGNAASLRVALAAIRDAQPHMLVGAAEYWRLAAASIRDIRASGPGGAAHGGELETSLMLHLQEDAVRSDAVRSNVPHVPAGFEMDLVDGGAVTLALGVDKLSREGQLGAGASASAEKGRRFFDAIVAAIVQALRAFAEIDVTAIKPGT